MEGSRVGDKRDRTSLGSGGRVPVRSTRFNGPGELRSGSSVLVSRARVTVTRCTTANEMDEECLDENVFSYSPRGSDVETFLTPDDTEDARCNIYHNTSTAFVARPSLSVPRRENATPTPGFPGDVGVPRRKTAELSAGELMDEDGFRIDLGLMQKCSRIQRVPAGVFTIPGTRSAEIHPNSASLNRGQLLIATQHQRYRTKRCWMRIALCTDLDLTSKISRLKTSWRSIQSPIPSYVKAPLLIQSYQRGFQLFIRRALQTR
jgi:hypothetical protein